MKNKSVSGFNDWNSHNKSTDPNIYPDPDSKDYATNLATVGDSDGSRPEFSSPILNESGGKNPNQVSLDSGYTKYEPKVVEEFNSC